MVSSLKVQEFLKSLLDPRSETFTNDCEAFQCAVVKNSSPTVKLPDEVKEYLKERVGTDVEADYINISKIARNGFQMYSKSCLRVKKQNSYTIKLERPVQMKDKTCQLVEVQSYVMVKSSRKVFAIGRVMEFSGSIIPRRMPQMQKIESVGDRLYAIPAENLLETMMVVKNRSSVYAALLPNNNERD
ncbi:uncharacterized protein [Argopecten irradians]|uniref:uncharacterized protein n=1 Tax=Argopecten irradians TaxID=31199 RepID=UPI0037129704